MTRYLLDTNILLRAADTSSITHSLANEAITHIIETENECIIIPQVIVGETATTNIQTLTFDDEDAISQLQQLNNSYQNAAIYLTGNLTIDFPEEVKIKIEPEEYTVIELTGSSLKFSWCPVEEALSYLKDQYAIGTLTAKIITPKPI